MVKEYFLAPHFNAPAPPRGVVKLGTILGRLDNFDPFNLEEFQPIPAAQLLPVETQDSVDIDIYGLHADRHPLTERALGLIGRGPRAPDRRPEGDHRVTSCKHLDTLAFIPIESYVRDTIDNLDDESYKPSSRSKRPVYMATGLKIAPEDFIVAFKVVQVWLDRKGEVKYKEYNKKAVMEFETSAEDDTATPFLFTSYPLVI
ncbi:uncharacterized protein FFUJ_06854 [Fusarium fujikuroi IMI 58289]|uniref:Uncharacterized protein n=2 Tax=Fusarium fujikuroi TaxID=5127 RepID=S0DZY5_GIBF5|nr:uncharacterized protein FFUJ_06854 [Fusarium fujikuroi IMI 58289]KLP02522.1 uncharacterized protein LW94_8135 [Fusarium fujikuroi]QGI64041.1 hypothetical protein CEK27_008012 [Fusarium fujikuroi]QGI81313.1 hypothetical protein CEK25_008042 [Fusarium fujikuroi]QGI94922.1 hypothetical protein CEK26_007991 [Fusarium fujikuroi]CCT68091.1 uncharacterized protein FFUJ_06854 [Fusarium fujikuroi IMI 58289]